MVATPTHSWWTRTTRYTLPEEFDDVEVAPLLCAGIIGYRALLRANLPKGGGSGSTGSAARPT